jgi:hypothetical protein
VNALIWDPNANIKLVKIHVTEESWVLVKPLGKVAANPVPLFNKPPQLYKKL